MRPVLMFCFCLLSSSVQAVELRSLDGSREQLQKLIEPQMWNVVMVWALDCVACEVQKPMIGQFHQEHEKSNAKVIGLVLDGVEAAPQIEALLKKKPTDFKNYLLTSVDFRQDLLVLTGSDTLVTPMYLIYTPDGDLEGVAYGPVQLAQLEELVGPATLLRTPSADLLR